MTKLNEKQEEALENLKTSAKCIMNYLEFFNIQEEVMPNDWFLTAIENSANCLKSQIKNFKEATPTEDYHANLHPIFEQVLNSFV